MSDKERKVSRKLGIGMHLILWSIFWASAYMVWALSTNISDLEGYHAASFVVGIVVGLCGMCAFYLACTLIQSAIRWLRAYRRHKSIDATPAQR